MDIQGPEAHGGLTKLCSHSWAGSPADTCAENAIWFMPCRIYLCRKQKKALILTVGNSAPILLLHRVHRLDVCLQLLSLRASISGADQEERCQHYSMVRSEFGAMPDPGKEVRVILVWMDLDGRACRLY